MLVYQRVVSHFFPAPNRPTLTPDRAQELLAEPWSRLQSFAPLRPTKRPAAAAGCRGPEIRCERFWKLAYFNIYVYIILYIYIYYIIILYIIILYIYILLYILYILCMMYLQYAIVGKLKPPVYVFFFFNIPPTKSGCNWQPWDLWGAFTTMIGSTRGENFKMIIDYICFKG